MDPAATKALGGTLALVLQQNGVLAPRLGAVKAHWRRANGLLRRGAT